MKVLKKCRDIVIASVLSLLCLLIYSEKWLLSAWDSSIEFSTVVYQLFSPLKGTGKDVMQSYIKSCVYPTLAIVVISMVLYAVLHAIVKKIVLSWKIEIGVKEIRICTESRQIKLFKTLVLMIVLCMMGIVIWKQAVAMGAVDYMKQITQRSVIYEEEYVDPEETAITFPGPKRNLILIYLESMETTYASVEVGGGKPINYIPELTELAFDNVSFSDDEDLGGASACEGIGWTMAALLASSAGVPYKLDIQINTAERYEKFFPGITTLGDILLTNGYHNYFMCGSDVSFAGRGDFYLQHGKYTLIDLNTARNEGFIENYYNNGFWGMEDEKLFKLAEKYLSDISDRYEPFNFTLLTVDTHHIDGYVCKYCDDQYDEQYANVIACSSRQVYEFVKWIQNQEWYENTSIVIVGDHLSMQPDFWNDVGGYDRKIYNCFINMPDDLVPVETKNRTFTTVDLFPSILAAMGAEIEGERLGLGVNLFSEERTIPEKIGIDKFNDELGYYSLYYFQHFIAGM